MVYEGIRKKAEWAEEYIIYTNPTQMLPPGPLKISFRSSFLIFEAYFVIKETPLFWANGLCGKTECL